MNLGSCCTWAAGRRHCGGAALGIGWEGRKDVMGLKIYTYITKKSWDKIKSPLDDLEI